MAILWLSGACGDDDDGVGAADAAAAGAAASSGIGGTGGTGASAGRDAGGVQTPGQGPGQPPSAPVPRTPADGATDVALETALCWEPSRDPEGDAVRYRVFVSGDELQSGKVADEGFAGPCTEPLSFAPDRSFTWAVQAYHPRFPESMSERSPTHRFRTARKDGSWSAFEDDFEETTPWALSGDATTGMWTFGSPRQVMDGGQLSQAGECAQGTSCVFTGPNPAGDASDEDVDGGSVVLESPPFDLSNAQSVTVSLSRFFYRGEGQDSGTRLQIELVLPDAAAQDGERVQVLEVLDRDDAAGQNAWTPVAFAACDLPFGPGARLRIRATDPGDNVVEAAIDSVIVTAHETEAGCQRGEGALCDPATAEACDGELLCCPYGTLNRGVYRCQPSARAIDASSPGGEGEALTGELGCPLPDLAVVADASSVQIETATFGADSCALHEMCVGGPGPRRLLRFDMRTQNVGARDLVLGVPANSPDQYHYDECHEHFHFRGFARYTLLDAQGQAVAHGEKIAQCVWDWGSWAWPGSQQERYSCYNQGISVGWEDEYDTSLDCQWIDITGVSPGDYTVRVEVNIPTAGFAQPRLVERSYDNNSTEFSVRIP